MQRKGKKAEKKARQREKKRKAHRSSADCSGEMETNEDVCVSAGVTDESLTHFN